MIYESNSINYADLFFGNCVIWVNLQVLRHNDYCYGVKLSSSPEQCYNWQGKLEMKTFPHRHDQCICIYVLVFVFFVFLYLYLKTYPFQDWCQSSWACLEQSCTGLLPNGAPRPAPMEKFVFSKFVFVCILLYFVFLYLLAILYIFYYFESVTVFS